MSEPNHPVPTDISLHRKSRLLAISFSDGASFRLPCEYLRVFSRAKEVRAMATPVTGKENVNIERIEPQGQYAVRLVFDDGHDTGIFSWETLYELGRNQQQNWQAYLERLASLGIARAAPSPARRIRLLLFAFLVQKFRKESLELELPERVEDVQGLLEWLRIRYPRQAPLLAPEQVRVTVNKQFTEPFTRLEDGDEVALVPTSPNPAPTPDL